MLPVSSSSLDAHDSDAVNGPEVEGLAARSGIESCSIENDPVTLRVVLDDVASNDRE